MHETFVQSFRLIAKRLQELIIQTFHSVFARNCTISKSKNAVILSKNIFFSSKGEVHIFNMPETLCKGSDSLLTTIGGVEYTNFL